MVITTTTTTTTLVGDGWVDPEIQAGTYAPFLKEHGLIGSATEDASYLIYDAYKVLVDAHAFAEADVIGNALLELLVEAAGNVDVYDIRYKNGDPTDPLQAALGEVLNRAPVQQLLNATGQQWTACANGPYFKLEGDIEQSSAPLFTNILAEIPGEMIRLQSHPFVNANHLRIANQQCCCTMAMTI